jgi:hypothetical protein
VESLIEQHRQEIEVKLPAEALSKLDCYLKAWRLSEEERNEMLNQVSQAVADRFGEVSEAESAREMIEEAEKLLEARRKSFGEEFQSWMEVRRPVETPISDMQTSLSRLPSIRMVAGWFLLIILLVLAFTFTH